MKVCKFLEAKGVESGVIGNVRMQKVLYISRIYNCLNKIYETYKLVWTLVLVNNRQCLSLIN